MLKVKPLLIGILLIQILTSCVNNSPNADSNDMNAWIDPSIQGQERTIIANALRTLPETWRDNVVLLSEDGNYYVNKLSLRGAFKKATPVSEGLYAMEDGTLLVAPQNQETESGSGLSSQQTSTCRDVGSGPYRKIATQPGVFNNLVPLAQFGYSKATVSLPAISNVGTKNPTLEEGHLYLGGTSSTGKEVDAGVQFFINADYPNGGWSAFARSGGYSYGPVMEPGTSLTMEFLVNADDQATLRLTGTKSTNPNNTNSLTFIHPVPGMLVSGAGNVLKRITSIAQNGGQNFESGAFLRGVTWSGATLGKSESAGIHPWGAFGTDVALDCATKGVTVDFFGYSEEDITINLAP
jgi:hypothetical protein